MLPQLHGFKGKRRMRIATMALLPICIIASLPSQAVFAADDGDFQAKTASQLARLCGADPEENNYVAAIHFCEGFMVGAYRYYRASLDGPSAHPAICLPQASPSRDGAAAQFVAWLGEHPEYRDANAVEAQFKWLSDTWPCK